MATAQLTLDGADRLYELLTRTQAPVSSGDAATCLFALRSSPSALVRQLVDEVVRADARFVWRSGAELALAEWDQVGSLLDLPLEQAEYVVFDLETTGTSPVSSRIVEVGAVRVSGLQHVATFERLVDPRRPVPSQITAITGITSWDVRGKPRAELVLNEFLHFAAGAVLVAHNARFDISFVDAELARGRGMRLAAPVIDTVMLGRRLLAGRVPRMNLATLAERFDTEVKPCHRALPDAQATADVLLALLGMAQERGAETVGDVIGLCAPVTRAARTRRSLAAGAPTGPGVYLFHGSDSRVLYVGKATDLRARVRSYFTGGANRRPVEDALAATERIETRPMGSEFEASLLELELIKRLRPPANRRSAHPERSCYLTLTTDEPVPRLRVTALPHPGAISAGPITSRSRAQVAAGAVRESLGLRTCRPVRPVDDGTCLAGELGRCRAPCRGGDAVADYDDAVARTGRWLKGDGLIDPTARLESRMRELGRQRRFEQAAAVRDQLAAVKLVGKTLASLRTAVGRSGVVLAPDMDDRFVQAFACARGRVVARRRIPRVGDARLEIESLLVSLRPAMEARPVVLEPGEDGCARLVSSALARPGRCTRPVPIDHSSLDAAAERIAAARSSIPLRD